MAIWELLPTDKKSQHWKCSYKKERVVVRAPSSDEARKLVALKLGRAPRKILGGATLYNPWPQHDLVVCNILTGSAYDENGPDEILEPREFNDI